jgi:cobalt-zinc-cadmium efflux system outer membrane protein
VHWDYESARLDVIRDVRQAFAAVLAAQDRVALAESLLDLSREAHGAVAQRVEAGKDSPVDELRAGVVLSKSRIELQKAQEALSVARHNLAAAWGDRTVSFERAAGDFYEVSPLAPPEDSVAEVAANPDIARWETQEQRQRAALRLEKARAAPDVIIGGGVQRFEETDDSALVFGLSVPIPLFDRNQGGIREAIANLGKTRRQYEAVLVRTLAALSNATGALAGAYDEVAILRDDVLPKAQQAFEAAQEGYQQGKFDYLYVLDTQRTLFEVQAQYLDSVEAWHKARAVVERLVGGTMRAADADHSSNASQEDSSREDSNEE